MKMHIKSGIYIGLDDEVYHAQRDWLGSTDIKELADDPVEWQWRRLHEEREDTPALVWGQALHKRVLEGHEAATQWLRDRPEKLRHLMSGKRMDELLREAGEEKVPRGLDDRAVMLVGLMPFDELLPDIRTAAKWMEDDPVMSAVMDDGSLSGGIPEVSIFARIDGVPRKARFDWLSGHAIIDLKTFAPVLERDLHKAIGKAIANFAYDVQAATYIDLWLAAKKLFRMGRVHGATDVQMQIMERAFSRRLPKWLWMFVKSKDAPQPMTWELPVPGPVYRAAAEKVRQACAAWKANMEEYGPDSDWHPKHAPVTLDPEMLPIWYG